MSFFIWLLATLAIAGALLAVLRKNPIHGAVAQMMSVMAVAGLLASRGAEAPGVLLVLSFGAALLIVGLTVVMFLDLSETDLDDERVSKPGIVIAFFLLAPITALCCGAFLENASADPGLDAQQGTEVAASMAETLAGPWLYLLQVSSFLLLASLVASVYLARGRR